MKTRNAETPKSGPVKKTPPKKDVAAGVDKTPLKTEATESTPKSTETEVKTPKKIVSTKKATPKAASKPETQEKKTIAKAKSPSVGKATVNANNSETPETKPVEAEKVIPSPAKEAAKKDEQGHFGMKEVDLNEKLKGVDDQMEDDAEEDADAEEDEYGEDDGGDQEEFEEPGDEEGEDDDQLEPEGGGGGMEEEQIQISAHARERKQKKAQEIFIGGLDRDADEDDVKKAFEKIGEVVEVRLLRNFVTNKNKGFAFVKFAEKEQAERALSELKSPVIRGKKCGLAPSEDNDTLFVGNICNTWTKEAIKRKLKEYGVEGVENITLVGDTKNEGLSRGFAFVEFSCHADAMLGYKRLQKPDVVFGHAERTVKVAFAEPLREPDAEVMAQVKSVFVDGLPPYWDEDRVREEFKDYGEIDRVVLARNMATAKRKDFGFVDFATHDAALACIEGVNNTELGDGKTKTKARARLANPLPKTQAVKGGMRGGFRIGRSGIGNYSRFGRGFNRGGRTSNSAGFQRGRGFLPRGRGRTGRFSFTGDNDQEIPHSEFRGRGSFGGRGGRRGSFRNTHEGSGKEFASGVATSSRPGLDRPRGGAIYRGQGKPSLSRRRAYSPEGEIGGRHFGDDSYSYGSVHGMKRPFSMMDHESSYLESGSRLRTRYDLSDPVSRGTRYRESFGTGGGLYSNDYYGTDYGASAYSSLYRGERSIGDGYYY
eukprot:TRINITY_DN1313_c0_g1_i1.p1 TRINITY_DN1313_c0_g1~~TRINITY_DN1313_c0_g1_i1.p1  ORF type:complete len:711 (+),score=164.69 TRINITY_DN1313_c0_g1_i1:100-2232(+)